MTEIVLVDGVGRPRVIELPDDDGWPQQLGIARDGQRSGPDRLVKFVNTGEVDAAGRIVYRQEGTTAAIREVYLPEASV